MTLLPWPRSCLACEMSPAMFGVDMSILKDKPGYWLCGPCWSDGVRVSGSSTTALMKPAGEPAQARETRVGEAGKSAAANDLFGGLL